MSACHISTEEMKDETIIREVAMNNFIAWI